MSCFIVPLAQAVTTSIIRNKLNKKSGDSIWKSELPSLEKILWGASLVLIVDHIASGELIWKFPFFTALGSTGGIGRMLNEMITVGLPMSLVLTAFWVALVLFKRFQTSS